MANNKNKSNYLLYAVLAIAFICGVLGVIAFVWEMNGKCKKTSKTTGKGSGDSYVENFRQSPYKIKEKFDLSQGTGAWTAASTITNGTGSDVCNADNLPDKTYLVTQEVMTDTGANSKDYTCQEFTLDSDNKVSGQGWFVGCQRPSDMLAPLYVAVANDCNPDGNVSNAAAFKSGGTCAGVSNKTDATGGVTIEKIANYFGRINSSGTGIDQTTLNQFTNSLDTHVAIWNATKGSYNDQGTPHANNQKLQPKFQKYQDDPQRHVKYYLMSDKNYFASDKPLNADFSVMDTVDSTLVMLDNASWEPQSVTSISSAAKTALETDPDVTSDSQIQNIKDENVTYAQFQQAFRKMLYADGTGAYSADACLGSSVGSS